MDRPLTYLLGPEAALTLATIVLYLFCARHNSGEGRDVAIMEKIVWMLPFLLAPFAFWGNDRSLHSSSPVVGVCGAVINYRKRCAKRMLANSRTESVFTAGGRRTRGKATREARDMSRDGKECDL